MKIKEFTLSKKFKRGLPNYSSIDVGMSMTIEVPEGEVPNFGEVWDTINRELTIQSDSLDPTWITSGETKDAYKFTIKMPKLPTSKRQGGGEGNPIPDPDLQSTAESQVSAGAGQYLGLGGVSEGGGVSSSPLGRHSSPPQPLGGRKVKSTIL